MKKILKITSILLAMVMILSLTACGKKNEEVQEEQISINLENINNKLNSLPSETFNLQAVGELIDQTSYFENLSYLYYYNFDAVLGLDNANIKNASIRMSISDSKMYMIIEPLQNEDVIKEQLSQYFQSIEAESELVKNRLETEYQGYLIYIVSNNNEEVLEVIKSARVPMFEEYMNLSNEMIADILGISETQYSEILVKMVLLEDSNIFIMVKPNEGEKDNIKNAIDTYLSDYENALVSFGEESTEQYEMLKNRTYEEYEGYLIWVVSPDNNKVLQAVKE